MRTLLSLLVAATVSLPAIANDAHHPEGSDKPAQAAPAAKSKRPSPSVRADAPKATQAPELDKQFAASEEQMRKMVAQMEKIRQTRDPKERQRFMQEHMQMMQENAQTMRATGGSTMMHMMDCPMMKESGHGAPASAQGNVPAGGATKGMDMGKMDNSQQCQMMGSNSAKSGNGSKMEMGQRMGMMEKRMDMMQMMMEQLIEREAQKPPVGSLP